LSGGASSSALIIAASSTAAPGTYQLTVRGEGQGVAEQMVPLSLTVTAPPSTAYRGTLTLARGVASTVFEDPGEIVDFDLASSGFTVRFNGIDPHRVPSGETAFIARLAPGAVANHGIVVADARGVTGTPLYVCRDFSWLNNRICHTPRLSPNKQLVAFGTAGDGGSVCQDSYGLYWANYVVVLDRNGAEVARFEGYYTPDWLPDGRLLMLGSSCRNAGVWIADASLRTLTRVDGNQIGTPAGQPAVSPSGNRVIFVWNQQLWMLTLDGRSELTKLTTFPFSVTSATWSPDGSAFAVLAANENLPLKAVILFRPGDREVLAVSLPFYPFGPLSWQ
jgi:WD40 repeat protein